MNLADMFDRYVGIREWDETVGQIQTWYYGNYEKSSWCASSLSYMANMLQYDQDTTFLDLMGGKNANVYYMMVSCHDNARAGVTEFYLRNEIPGGVLLRGDIIFWLWSGSMGPGANKHVGVCAQSVTLSAGATVKCIGGNQSNQVKVASTGANYYRPDQIYAIYRILEPGQPTPPPYPDPPQPYPDPPEPSPTPRDRIPIWMLFKLGGKL